jgi:hypothetical protein
VQIDQVLSVLQGSRARAAQTLMQGYGDALNGKPSRGGQERAPIRPQSARPAPRR